jgi:multiple sugar transport system ATP-binding protein
MSEVKFEHVDKVFDSGTKVISDLNLKVADSEFLVLVGPSGCGKTTALRMVAGLEAITSGTISIGDRVVNNLTSKDRDIAMVFQNYALYPHLSVADNIAFGLRLRKEPKDQIAERVAWAAKLLDLEPYLGRRPKDLSGGQRQRVAMGRAIVRKPKVFLMDEPLSNLDAKLRIQMRAEIANLQKHLNTTTIYVTHDQVEAMTMGDRVAVMSMGVLQQVDDPRVIYNEPANLFVAGFIGTPPMNLFEANLERDGDGMNVVLAGQRIALPARLHERYPGVNRSAGRQVVVGARPEDIHLASTKPDMTPISAKLGLLEILGSSQIAYMNIAAQKVSTSTTAISSAQGSSLPESEASTSFTHNLVAFFPPQFSLRLDENVTVVLDAANLHFFDMVTGIALR